MRSTLLTIALAALAQAAVAQDKPAKEAPEATGAAAFRLVSRIEGELPRERAGDPPRAGAQPRSTGGLVARRCLSPRRELREGRQLRTRRPPPGGARGGSGAGAVRLAGAGANATTSYVPSSRVVAESIGGSAGAGSAGIPGNETDGLGPESVTRPAPRTRVAAPPGPGRRGAARRRRTPRLSPLSRSGCVGAVGSPQRRSTWRAEQPRRRA